MRFKRVIGVLSSLCLFATLHPPIAGNAQGFPEICPTPLTAGTVACIGVDHFDPANQQVDPTTGIIPDGGKLFEYTDFFTRSVEVHQGDVVDFQVAIPDHLVQVVPSANGGNQQDQTGDNQDPNAEAAARHAFPLFTPDEVTPTEGTAAGSGGPKIVLGPPVLASLAPGGIQPCGDSVATACDPTSQFSVTSFPSGPASNWFVAFNAAPGSSYTYFCHLHPGMRGKVTVVGNNTPLLSQAQIKQRADVQFLKDQAEGQKAYTRAQVPSFTGGKPGSRTYTVHVGVTTKDRHVAIHDMLPSALSLAPGDRVRYEWQSNVIHTVSFNAGPGLVSPFGVDCETSYAPLNAPPPPLPNCPSGAPEFEGPAPGPPELIADPGSASSGSALTMAAGADSGVLAGSGYAPFYGNLGSDHWVLKGSEAGTYRYQCTIHDWMVGTLVVSG